MQSPWFAALICLLPLVAGAFAAEDGKSAGAKFADPTFVGAEACAGCHAAQTESWSASHHAKAMQPATAATVLGDFANATLTRHGVTTTFSRAGDAFIIGAEGPDGAQHDYRVAYTFGVFPLQQYLVAFPGGRYQAFGAAWDARPKDQGGQRWIDLYPDRTLAPGDALHWTGRDQTWNYQCAACHSTDLKKNYGLAADAFETTWKDVNVSCEACHGPGSRHLAWAQAQRSGHASDDPRKGLTTWLAPEPKGLWRMNPETGIAGRAAPQDGKELDVCAACHARRRLIAETAPAGAPLLDKALPALLEPGLYHADGQIDGEVFEYGSFIQSRMFHAGVTCSNCHEPHSLALRAEGNALCAQCHLPAKFDAVSHHHHEPGSAGAQCVNCHMPAKTYMIVDDRRDHSLRVPRPDLTMAIGAPNACASCHMDKSSEWAARAVAEWFPGGRQTKGHYGIALAAGRAGAPQAERLLDELVLDAGQPAMARASALALLARSASPRSEAALRAGAADPDPLVRAAVPRALPAAPSAAMVEVVASLLADPVRGVRIEAARGLVGVDPQSLPAQRQTEFAAAYLELFAAEMVNAERPETHLNLGLFETQQRRPEAAEAQYRTALRLDPRFTPALVNLADLDRMRGMDSEGGDLLREAIAIDPANADARHALGLLLVRQKQYVEALAELRRAAELAPDNARYAYVLAIALQSTGARDEAMKLLEETHRRRPADRDVLVALLSNAQQSRDLAATLRYAEALSALEPENMQLRLVIEQLRKRQKQ